MLCSTTPNTDLKLSLPEPFHSATNSKIGSVNLNMKNKSIGEDKIIKKLSSHAEIQQLPKQTKNCK